MCLTGYALEQHISILESSKRVSCWTLKTLPDCALQVQALHKEQESQKQIVAATKATTPEKLYNEDLDAFIEALEDYEQREQALLGALKAKQRKAGGKIKSKQSVSLPQKSIQLYEILHYCYPTLWITTSHYTIYSRCPQNDYHTQIDK